MPTLAEVLAGMKKLELLSGHLVEKGKPTPLAKQLIAYFAYRAKVLNETVQYQLMDKVVAEAMYNRLLGVQK